MRTPGPHRWLHRFTVFTAISALVLICFGGLVTSHGAGLAVPDWPNTFGYNLFFFPVSQWVGGIFYEHTHRLVASGVGLLTTILAVWIWMKEPRAWLRWLGVGAFAAVVIQGVLGGLRVILLKDHIGIVHGALAQLFLVLVCLIALFTSPAWQRFASQRRAETSGRGLRWLALSATALVFVQLLLGATMRHRHAGLAIPDFPAAYGQLWPAMDADSVARYNQQRMESRAVNPIASLDVALQMAHRIGACLILVTLGLYWRWMRSRLGPAHGMTRAAAAWLVLVGIQFCLGAATIWTGKSADVATAHVAVGSVILAFGALQAVVAIRLFAPADRAGDRRFSSDPASKEAALHQLPDEAY